MAVTERVRIHIESSADLKAYADAMVVHKVWERQVKRTEKLFRGHANMLDRAIAFQLGQAAKAAGLFGQRLLRMNLKGFGIELAGITTGLLLMKAALATGRWVARAWGSTISFLKASVAGLTAAVIGLVGVLAAANREFAQLQMRPFAGGGTSAAAGSMRGPLSHGGMQIMGMAATQQMVSTLNRAHPGFASNNGRLVNQMSQAVGYDPKAAVGYAQALAAAKTSGSSQPVSDFLRSQGHIYRGVAQKAAGMQVGDLRGAITGGELTPRQMRGQEGRLQNTLMGQVKGALPRMFDLFSTIGGPLIDPLRNALRDIEGIIVNAMHRMSATIHQFGLGTFIPGMVAQVQRFADWITKIVIQDLPRLMTVLRAIRDWWMEFWNAAGRWFSDLEDRMKKFEEAAATSWQMVRNVFGKFWEWYKEKTHEWNDLINANAGAYEGFGDALGNVLVGIGKMLTRFKDAFFENLPAINQFFRFLTDEVFPKLGDFAEAFANAFSSALPVIESIVRALMPLLLLVTGIVGMLNAMGPMGSALAVGLGYLGMSARGHRGAGMFMSGMFNPIEPHRQTVQQQQSVMYQTGHNANRNRGKMFTPKPGRLLPGVAWGRGVIGGGMAAMGTMALAGIVGAAGGGNQVTQGISESAMTAAPMMFIPGLGAAAAGVFGGQMLINKAHEMRGFHAAGTAGAIGGAAQAAGLVGLASAAGLTGPPGWAAAGVILAAAGVQYIISGLKGDENTRAYGAKGVELGTAQASHFKTQIGLQSTRQGIRSKMKAYDVLLGDDSRIAELAEQNHASFESTRDQMILERAGVKQEGLRAIDAYEDAMLNIAGVTGKTADEVETLADRWGLALHNARDEVEFFFKLTERYKTYRSRDGHLRGITQNDYRATFTGMFSDQVEGGLFAENGWRPGTTLTQARQQSAASFGNLLSFMAGGGTVGPGTAEALDFQRTTFALFSAAGITGARQGSQWAALAKRGPNGEPSLLEQSAKRMGFDIDAASFDPLLAEIDRVSNAGMNLEAFKATQLGGQMNTLMTGIGQAGFGNGRFGSQAKRDQILKGAMESGDPETAMTLLNLDIHSEATKEAAMKLAELATQAQAAAQALGLIAGDYVAEHGTKMGRRHRSANPNIDRDPILGTDDLDGRSPGAQLDRRRLAEIQKARFDLSKWDWGLTGLAGSGIKTTFTTLPWNR